METNLREWLAEMGEQFRENPSRAPLYVVYTCYLIVWFAVTSRMPLGRNVYDRDWDLLVVLDACRVDALREVADEYDFIDEVGATWSVGSHSAEWLAQTFTADHRAEIGRTHLVTANAHADQILEQGMRPPVINTLPVEFSRWDCVGADAFDSAEMVWEALYDETYRVALPDAVTDYTIDVARTRSPDRLVVHYMQPHLPYIGRAYRDGRRPTQLENDGYRQLETGEADRDEVYGMYADTLRLVLDQVAVLLDNVDADRVAITADHGEAFGELFAYGHPEGFPHPVVKKVPWVETTAEDRGTREPDVDTDRRVDIDVEDHLRDLGYR